MKGTLISILVGALAGVLLTVGSNVRASHAAASVKQSSSDIIAPAPVAPDTVSDSAVPPAPSDQASLEK